MIKKKTQFKQIEGGAISSRLTVAALDEWYLVSPIVSRHSELVAMVSREVEVTKENLWELILYDFKSEIGSILCEEHNRLATFLDNEKAQQFIVDTTRRYKIKEEVARQILILNLEEVTWTKDTGR